MKIGYMVIEILLICCVVPSLECADHKNAIQSMAGLSRSASSFFVSPTSPIPAISPYRDQTAERVTEYFPKLTKADRRRLSKKNTSELIINYESNCIFEKVPVVKEAPKVSSLKEVLVKELKKDQPLSASVDSNGPETIET